jgi:putative flippase GtrA
VTGGRWRAAFARYCTVGASGYAVNSGLFVVLQRVTPYPVAFALAFVAAATGNFVLNRAWTFRATGRRASPQYVRFLAVSLAALATDLLVLVGLVEAAGAPRFAAAAVAIVVATPASFLGNRLWTFRTPAASAQLRTATIPPLR